MYMHVTHIFNLAIITIALFQYKAFSLQLVDGTAMFKEYPSVSHRLKLQTFLPILGITESKSIINESTPPRSGPHSLLTVPFIVFLGAACGSPYIVFISTSGM